MMIRLFSSAVLLFICITKSMFIYAQTSLNLFGDTKTEKWTVRSFENDPLNVRVYTFNNGLQLITSNQLKEPRIYTMIAVKTGSANDPANHTGLAHYLEHMLFKGTDVYGSLDFEKEAPMLDKIEALYEENITLESKSKSALEAAIAILREKNQLEIKKIRETFGNFRQMVLDNSQNIFLSPMCDGPIKFNKTIDGNLNIENISKFVPKYFSLEQQDSHECLMYILDLMHKGLSYEIEVNIVGDVKNENDQLMKKSLEQWSSFYEKEYSFIIETFYGMFFNNINCNNFLYFL